MLLFADDLVMLAETEETLQHSLQEMNKLENGYEHKLAEDKRGEDWMGACGMQCRS